MTNWIPMFCPNCGYEDDADAAMLDRGYVLRCPDCNIPMQTEPAEEPK